MLANHYTKSPSRDKRRFVCHLEPLDELLDCTTSQKRKPHHPMKNLEHNVRERTFWFDGVQLEDMFAAREGPTRELLEDAAI
jgi:hypothetical protein